MEQKIIEQKQIENRKVREQYELERNIVQALDLLGKAVKKAVCTRDWSCAVKTAQRYLASKDEMNDMETFLHVILFKEEI